MSLLVPIVPAAELEPGHAKALLQSASSGRREALALSHEPEALLTGALRRVVLASFRDGLASLGSRRWRARFTRIVFGVRPPAPYANDRLELLRRYAILYRLEGGALALDEDERLLAAGFSPRQVEAARAMVDDHLRPVRDRPRVPLTLTALVALAAAAATLLYRWMAAQFDDSSGALIVTILLATWVVSIVSVTSHPHERQHASIARDDVDPFHALGGGWKGGASGRLAGRAAG